MNEEILKSSRVSRVAERLQSTCEDLSASDDDFTLSGKCKQVPSLTERSNRHKNHCGIPNQAPEFELFSASSASTSGASAVVTS